MFVPVIDSNQKPLMPTTPSRARRWIRDRKATGFWKRGIYCVRLNAQPSSHETQPIAVGIDPGSKREGYSIKSEDHTYLNLQATAVSWVKDAIQTRKEMRRARRFRKTPCRKNRANRARGGLPPSTKARWQWKLRVCAWLAKMFPITTYVIEDIATATKGQRKWDVMFSPLEVGKHWFYSELAKTGKVETRQGWETKELRDLHGLKKSEAKLAEVFSAHCVDSWVLANWWTGGHDKPDNERMLCIEPLRFHRRQLHRLQPEAGGKRKPYGGTISNGFKRGALVVNAKLGLTYVGGYLKDRISLHSVVDGKRLTQTAKTAECKFLSYNTWRTRLLPMPEGRGFRRAVLR
jgi:hypothetical protein